VNIFELGVLEGEHKIPSKVLPKCFDLWKLKGFVKGTFSAKQGTDCVKKYVN